MSTSTLGKKIKKKIEVFCAHVPPFFDVPKNDLCPSNQLPIAREEMIGSHRPSTKMGEQKFNSIVIREQTSFFDVLKTKICAH